MANIMETLTANGSLNIFSRLIKIADFADMLDTGGPFTVFAPLDEAFNELPKETLDALLAGEDLLPRVLNNHFVLGELTVQDLPANPLLDTQAGEKIAIDIFDETIMVSDGAIVQSDIEYDDGQVQVIDSVLLPQEKSGPL